jgi:hypothetical protein
MEVVRNEGEIAKNEEQTKKFQQLGARTRNMPRQQVMLVRIQLTVKGEGKKERMR